MHASLKEALPVEGNPLTYRALPIQFWQGLMGKVSRILFWSEIDIGEDRGTRRWMLHDLRAPSRYFSGIESFPWHETQHLQQADQTVKMTAGAPKREMIAIGPSQSHFVLGHALYTGCRIA